ncbi:MAG: BrnA antitoxin family protein [Silvanigrellaceae bacterium]|nr:BrnA antitoxin family protein [Silvanigrellaceae bacterium]
MNKYVKNTNENDYNEIEFDNAKVAEGYKKHKKFAKNPTSINLPEETIVELKALAIKKGVGYQTLMRMIILEGIERMKKSA